jgi:hypothetical protein
MHVASWTIFERMSLFAIKKVRPDDSFILPVIWVACPGFLLVQMEMSMLKL